MAATVERAESFVIAELFLIKVVTVPPPADLIATRRHRTHRFICVVARPSSQNARTARDSAHETACEAARPRQGGGGRSLWHSRSIREFSSAGGATCRGARSATDRSPGNTGRAMVPARGGR